MQEKFRMIAILVLLVLTSLSTILYWWNLPLAQKKNALNLYWKVGAK